MDNDGFNTWQAPQGDPFGEQRPPRGETESLRARDYRAMARNALRGFWTIAVIVTLIAAILGGTSSAGTFSGNVNVDTEYREYTVGFDTDYQPLEQLVQQAMQFYETHPWIKTVTAILGVLAMVQFVIGGPVMLGYNRFKLHLLDGQEAQFSDLFSCFGQFIEALWMRIRIFLQTFAWALLLIIPGIVAAYRYALVPYLMAEHPDMTTSEAFRHSKALMQGRKWRLFCLHLSFIGWWIVAALTLGIASLWINPYQQMAETAFYRSISAEVRS